jgi:D-alanyl-D-alanine carboxypeptidase (penicillin-binding protein 5/6)
LDCFPEQVYDNIEMYESKPHLRAAKACRDGTQASVVRFAGGLRLVAAKPGHILFKRFLICFLAVLPFILGLYSAGDLQVRAATDAATPTATEAASGNSNGLTQPAILHSAESAIVIETSRQRRLYAKNADLRQNIPTASKIMTALIACERPLDTQVTISKVAASADSNRSTPDGIVLKSGDKYPLKYLLYRLLYYNSNAAALAIAEHIADVEEDFVTQMNSRAASIGLTSTIFKNCTGEPGLQFNEDGIVENLVQEAALQYTTPADLAKLVYQAISNPDFSSILNSSEVFMMLDGSVLITMYNALQGIQTRSEGLIRGVFYCRSGNQSYMVAVGTVNNINIISVTAGGNADQGSSDLIALFQGCRAFYESTPLVIAGDSFSQLQEQTVDGEYYGLVYKQTVYYVHPIGNPFIRGLPIFNSFGPFSRPIQRSKTVGQVIFELEDGTMIAIDVVPDRQILSSISILDKALGELQSNYNLTVLLLVCSILLLLIIFFQIIGGFRRLLHLVRLIVLEKRSRR